MDVCAADVQFVLIEKLSRCGRANGNSGHADTNEWKQ